MTTISQRAPTIRLRVDVFAGVLVEHAAEDMVNLANRVGVLVAAGFNGVEVWARPGDDPKAIAADYDVQIQKPSHLFRIAQDRKHDRP